MDVIFQILLNIARKIFVILENIFFKYPLVNGKYSHENFKRKNIICKLINNYLHSSK